MDKEPGARPRLGKEKLTIRERKLIKSLVKGNKMSAAARDAGYGGSLQTARKEGERATRKPNVAAALDKALDIAGLTISKQAQVLADATGAERVTYFNDGATEKREPDHLTRVKAVDTAAKWRGVGQGQEQGGQVFNVGFFVMRGLQERGIPIDIEAES